jgi:elongation factor P--beta-lysine ligase
MITKHGGMLRSMLKNPMFHYLHLRTFSTAVIGKQMEEAAETFLMSSPDGSPRES